MRNRELVRRSKKYTAFFMAGLLLFSSAGSVAGAPGSPGSLEQLGAVSQEQEQSGQEQAAAAQEVQNEGEERYKVILPPDTQDYTVRPDTAYVDVTEVEKDGSYGFRVSLVDGGADGHLLVKSNGIRIKGSDDGLYMITDIREDQVVTVEYTRGVEPNEYGEYEIFNEVELLSVMEKASPGLVMKLCADISFSSGTLCTDKESAFTAVLDGQGHTVSGLRGPLFGWIGQDGSVKDLRISGTLDVYGNSIEYGDTVNVNGLTGIGETESSFLGTVAAVNYGSITDCTSDAVLDSTRFPNISDWGSQTGVGLGGIVGNNFGTVESCAFYGAVQADAEWEGDSSGGIAAQNDGVIRRCYNKGTISGYVAGGIVGRLNNYYGDEMPAGIVEDCYNVGTVRAGGGTVGGAIAGFTNAYNASRHPGGKDVFMDALKNNYFLSGTYRSGFDGSNDVSVVKHTGRAESMTEDQMRSLDIITALNKNSETSVFIKDTANGGYPIFAWQGTPNADSDTVAIELEGDVRAQDSLTAVVTTALENYSVEWLLIDDDGFGVITETKTNEDGEEIQVPYNGLTLSIEDGYVGKYLKVRVTDNGSTSSDGSSVVSELQGPVTPAPIKKIYFEGSRDDEAVLDLIYDDTVLDTEQAGEKAALRVLADPMQSSSLLEGQAIQWSSSDGAVVAVTAVEDIYDPSQEALAEAVVEAKGVGTADITVTIGEYSATAKVTVHPAYVTVKLRMGMEGDLQEITAKSEDLSEIWEGLEGAPQYVTPLHILKAYAQEQEKNPETYVTVQDGKVSAVDGEEGKWIYVASKTGGAIDAPYAVQEGAEITVMKVDQAVDKVAFWEKDTYSIARNKELEVSVQASVISDNSVISLAGAAVKASQNGNDEGSIRAVADADGKAVLKFTQLGTYELTASHTNADGESDIVILPAQVTVGKEVTGITGVEDAYIMHVGTIKALGAKAEPEDAMSTELIYTSDNEAVASVGEDGVVTAKSAGTAYITVAALDDQSVKKEISIRVVQPVTQISLSPNAGTVKVGSTIQIQAKALPEDATDKKLVYTSSAANIATVDANGVVTGKAAGTAKITIAAADGNGAASQVYTVTVEKGIVNVSSVALNKKKASLQISKTVTLKATVAPSNASNKTVTWKSSNKKVAAVSSSGKVTAKKAGTAKITASVGGKNATCTITVKKPTIKLNKAKLSLKKGRSSTAVKIRSSSSGVEKIKAAKSNKKKVASVQVKKGKLTIKGKKKGKATITITSTNGAKKKIIVTVK